jgi:hypothetical protein
MLLVDLERAKSDEDKKKSWGGKGRGGLEI